MRTVMPKKKKSAAVAWTDPDDAPPLTEAFFDRAEIWEGNKLVRRGQSTRRPLNSRRERRKKAR
jgi:hypothetical protein